MPSLFVDHLTVMDFTYLDPARGLVGESWIVDVELEGALDENGMVFDFGDVKKQIKRMIDQSFDHKFVVPAELPGLSCDHQADSLVLRWRDAAARHWEHHSPLEAVVLMPGESIAMAATERWLENLLRHCVPDNVDAVHIRLRNEMIDGAYYHYTHGLKKHTGNCQRIAHGHRSALMILIDGSRDHALEAQWAGRWRDIYIGSQEDIRDEVVRDGVTYVTFAYQSSQGHYALSLPREHTYVIDCDSTVELIAEHLADAIAATHTEQRIEVRAFEGVWKGARARR